MARKSDSARDARNDGDVPPWGKAAATKPRHVRRRSRLIDSRPAKSGREAPPARPITRRAAFVVEPNLDVVDDFPRAIPPARRELDVIETYLAGLLDDVLGAA
jgi:hypothetical protein